MYCNTFVSEKQKSFYHLILFVWSERFVIDISPSVTHSLPTPILVFDQLQFQEFLYRWLL